MRVAEVRDLKGKRLKCSFCNDLAVAVWMNGDEPHVSVCRNCAVRVLMSLVADATWMTPVYGLPRLNGIIARFWQCYAHAQFRFINANRKALAFGMARYHAEEK